MIEKCSNAFSYEPRFIDLIFFFAYGPGTNDALKSGLVIVQLIIKSRPGPEETKQLQTIQTIVILSPFIFLHPNWVQFPIIVCVYVIEGCHFFFLAIPPSTPATNSVSNQSQLHQDWQDTVDIYEIFQLTPTKMTAATTTTKK